jgi:hypothetical protein
MKLKTVGLLALAALVVAIVAPRAEKHTAEAVAAAPVRAEAVRASLDACINKGIGYYQQVGSYPRLTDGRNAVDVARERCQTQANPFP